MASALGKSIISLLESDAERLLMDARLQYILLMRLPTGSPEKFKAQGLMDLLLDLIAVLTNDDPEIIRNFYAKAFPPMKDA